MVEVPGWVHLLEFISLLQMGSTIVPVPIVPAVGLTLYLFF